MFDRGLFIYLFRGKVRIIYRGVFYLDGSWFLYPFLGLWFSVF
jgi:hypothetical protein